ncbi:extracellular solute-binding protein [Paenibacillus sp. sptzw28]|uniref:ABC transporter substrate-binding protein n=1 Tax=Paenibacillus sp. sptzw28 TaxID=715179 RepID=UPI001C6DEE11|nr:sugar ABC transporter substrate-binding protein [Paenibacillus sp. sptzw28]QYR22468.1 extracellular solute-binding protein [Paenibacillus sp. sptzw28]
MKRSLLLLAATVFILSMVLSACGSGNTSGSNGGKSGETATAKDKVTINLVAFAQPHEQKMYTQLIKKYQEKYPHVKVNYITTPPADYPTKLQAMIAGGQTPDVFYASPENVSFMVDTNQLLDLTPYIEKTSIFNVDNIWKKGLSKYTRDGKTYALPKDVGPFAYAYNKTLFEKAGIPTPDPKTPLTWDEYISIAKKLTLDDKGNNAESPDFNPKKIKQYGAGFWWHEPAVWGNGADYINEDGTKVTIDDPKFIESLQFVADLRNKYHVVPSSEDETAMGGYTRWLNGTVAMFPMGPWDTAAFWDLKFDYDLMPWPSNNGTWGTWLGSQGFGVSAKTKSPQEAFDLVAFLSVDPDIQREAMTMGLQVPNLIDMAKNDYLKMTDKKPVNKQVFLDVIETNGHDWSFEKTYDREWYDLFNSSVTQVWEGKKTPEAFVKELQPKMQELVDKSAEKKKKAQGQK